MQMLDEAVVGSKNEVAPTGIQPCKFSTQKNPDMSRWKS